MDVIATNPDLPFLTIRQNKMLRAYLEHGNATQAYKDAGYSSTKYADRNAHILVNRSPLKDHLEYFRAKSAVACDKDWITDRLKGIVARTEHDEYDAAIKALSELNKMQGNYAPLESISKNLNVDAAIEDIRNARAQYKLDK